MDLLKKGDFKRLALEGYKNISDNTQHSIKRIYRFSRWLQIKAIVTTLITDSTQRSLIEQIIRKQ